MIDSVLRAIDKEFSLPANYPKGHGDWFKFWMKKITLARYLFPWSVRLVGGWTCPARVLVPSIGIASECSFQSPNVI